MIRKKTNQFHSALGPRNNNQKHQYRIPRIDDTVDCLSGRFLRCFWQVKLKLEDKEESLLGATEMFTMIPFGLTFQRMTELVLHEVQWKCTCAYIDDILVFSKEWSGADGYLVPKGTKYFFDRFEQSYLGNLNTAESIRPDPSKTEAVESS